MPATARLAALLLLIIATPLAAQHPNTGIAGPRSSQLFRVVARGPLQQPPALDSLRREIRPTHWKEGALVGGLVTGLSLGLLVDGLCRQYEGTGECAGALTGGFVVGAVIGGVTGALVGGQFPKRKDP